MVGFFFRHQSAMALCCMVVQASATTSLFIELLPPCLSCRMAPHRGPTAVHCLDLLSRPHIPAPSPCLQWWTPSQAGWAGQGSVACVQVSHCPAATDCCCVLFPQRMRLLFCLNWAPQPVKSFPGCGDSPLFRSPQSCRSHSTSFPVPFPSFFSCPFKAGIILDLFIVHSLCSLWALKILPFLMYSCCVCGER